MWGFGDWGSIDALTHTSYRSRCVTDAAIRSAISEDGSRGITCSPRAGSADRDLKTAAVTASAASKTNGPARVRVDDHAVVRQGSDAGDATGAANDGPPDP